MADNLTPEQRKLNMERIKSRHTKPEILVRSLIHEAGYRFRLHYLRLPGRPDIVLPRHRKIVLVHGCFWHQHSCKRGRVSPKTNPKYWEAKITRNVTRDRANVKAYKKAGWKVLTVWECETRDAAGLRRRLLRFLRTEP